MNAYYYYYCYYFLQIDTNYLYDNRNNRLIETNYLLAIIRFVFKYKEETEKAYLIQLPANVVCFCERTMKRTHSHIPTMGLTKCQEFWTLKEQKEFESMHLTSQLDRENNFLKMSFFSPLN